MSWRKFADWLRSVKLELLLSTSRSYWAFGLMPLNWSLEASRDLGLAFSLGPLRVDVSMMQLSRGWIPPTYLTADVGKFRYGASLDCLGTPECPYMKRLILWLGPLGNLRLHKFYRSDQDEALHDHPWRFVTFPLTTYQEWVPLEVQRAGDRNPPTIRVDWDNGRRLQLVKRFRFHYRPAEYRHAVVVDKPGYTLVWAGNKVRSWGFWLRDVFTPWRTWTENHPIPPCADRDEVAKLRSVGQDSSVMSD